MSRGRYNHLGRDVTSTVLFKKKQEDRNKIVEALTAAAQAVEAGYKYNSGSKPPTNPAHDPVGAALQSGAAALNLPTTGDPDLDWLIHKESRGRVSAKNPKSSAFGLGQLISSQRRLYAQRLGIQDPDTVNFGDQLAMMKSYVADRYGSSSAAKKFWERHGWY